MGTIFFPSIILKCAYSLIINKILFDFSFFLKTYSKNTSVYSFFYLCGTDS